MARATTIKKSKAARLLPKASLDKLKGLPIPALHQLKPGAPTPKLVQAPSIHVSSVVVINPDQQVIGLGGDGKLYFWDFKDGSWRVAAPPVAETSVEESELDKPQINKMPPQDPLA